MGVLKEYFTTCYTCLSLIIVSLFLIYFTSVLEASGAVISSTKQSSKSSDAVGRTFPTLLRAQAAANLANKDRSSLKRAHESVESLSQTSSVPGDDANKG